MAVDLSNNSNASVPSYAEILRELIASATELIQNEATLIKAEASQTVNQFKSHLTQLAIFGVLSALSVLPLLAFAVIGLGELLDGRYWLSSLIVAALCAGIGGTLAYRALKKIQTVDLEFKQTRRRIENEVDFVQDKVEDVKNAAKGNPIYETPQLT